MQIRNIRKGFKAFESKFEAFESYWKHLNAKIRAIRKDFEAF